MPKTRSLPDRLGELYQLYSGNLPADIQELPRSGSHRRYYRITDDRDIGCIGVFSPDARETDAFLHFTHHFRSKGLPVPEILHEQKEQQIYLLEDLGDLSLKEKVDQIRDEGSYPSAILPLYKQALEILIRFQVEGGEGLDYTRCVPRESFDEQSILWDLNHFKYLFLKISGIPFDEAQLEKDFRSFAAFLAGAPAEFFLYRDFQARNIMISRAGELRFIDYQGGRRGSLQYDVASLLFEARTDLSIELKKELLDHYLATLSLKTGIKAPVFMEHYYGFVLIRILQAMGAYGLRGIVENKPLFLQSIPFAVRNLRYLMEEDHVPEEFPALRESLKWMVDKGDWPLPEKKDGLRIQVRSFSYKKGIPEDYSGHGGGFVFDCRALPNPGRESRFRNQTGRDTEVIKYLEAREEVRQFIEHSWKLVRASLFAYRERGFEHLSLSFGCTGGQHRSVYCAEKMARIIKSEFEVGVDLVHRDLPR